jgi:peptide/nickel transport system ATP-binding protein
VILCLGRIVEVAPTEELFRAPNHPYTQALLANVPRIEGRSRSVIEANARHRARYE